MIEKQFGESDWSIFRIHQQVEGWAEAIAMMKIARVQTLSFTGYHNPLVLREISHIQFPCLTALYLYDNQILSLEAITHLKAPALKQLRFGDNLIVEMRSLRRACLPSLIDLRFHRNKINHIHFLSQMQCHSTIQHLTIESLGSDLCTSQDIGQMIKESSRSTKIECYSEKRVAWRKLKTLFSQIFSLQK